MAVKLSFILRVLQEFKPQFLIWTHWQCVYWLRWSQRNVCLLNLSLLLLHLNKNRSNWVNWKGILGTWNLKAFRWQRLTEKCGCFNYFVQILVWNLTKDDFPFIRDLSYNNFTGDLPSSFGSLTNLGRLYVSSFLHPSTFFLNLIFISILYSI